MDNFYILVQGKGRRVEVAARQNGTVSEATLTHAFQLEPPVGLFRNGRALEVRREGEEILFVLESNWVGAEFELQWREERRPAIPGQQGNMFQVQTSRYESPYKLDEALANDMKHRLFFLPRAQDALQDAETLSIALEEDLKIDDGIGEPKERKFPFVTPCGGCASPISTRAAVTFAHQSHKILREFDENGTEEDNKHSLVVIRNCVNPTITHLMKVIVVDTHHDFIILREAEGKEIFQDYSPCKRAPRSFERFLGFGLGGHKNENRQQITHRFGRICSQGVDHRGRFLASGVSFGEGDSGGPCYSADRSLIGIMVASTAAEPRLDYPEGPKDEIINASSSQADTWITPGSTIQEAYSRYLVKTGILRVPRELERGEPRAKRRAINSPAAS